jgi:hypothetical protein
LAVGRSLPSIEELSDILCPDDARATAVVQVKRTLTRAKLAQALKEFAWIVRLIHDRHEATLLDSLRYVGPRHRSVHRPPRRDDGSRHHRPVRGATIVDSSSRREFGYTLMIRSGGGWDLLLKDPLEKTLLTCWIEGNRSHCTAGPAARP